jgi:5'-nucleotidase
MKILVTNDDGYRAKGVKSLANIMKKYGEVTVVAPKTHQSGTSMAVTLGFRPIAVRDFGDVDGVRWYYVDATPASCVKFAVDNIFTDGKPDLVVSGINHGTNTATAACYSGTLGAVEEASLSGIPSIGVSLDNLSADADFSVVEELFPALLDRIMASGCFERGTFLNVNYPNLPASEIKGVRLAHMGLGHWEKEFQEYDPEYIKRMGIDLTAYSIRWVDFVPEPGEELYFMVGTFVDDPDNVPGADHHLVKEGYVTVTVHNLDNTDRALAKRLRDAGFESGF